MIAWWASTVGHAAPPLVALRWRGSEATVEVSPPPDRKIAVEAPASLSFTAGERTWSVDGPGPLALAVPALLRGVEVHGQIALGLCRLDGTECQLGTWSFRGLVPDRSAGRVPLTVNEGAPAPFGPTVTAVAAEEALRRAKDSGRAVLLDFSAVWCPPCNVLAAEVLHGPPAPELDGYEVAVLDVDHPSSFPWKARYAITGYPTLVVIDAEGREQTRYLGYESREDLLAWLATAAGSTDASDLDRDPATVSPARAAGLGLLLVERGAEDRAGPWLARAAADPEADPVSFRLLRYLLQPTPADLEWLLDHAPDRATEYAHVAVNTPGDLAKRAVTAELQVARGPALAGALEHAAKVAAPADRATYYAAAAGVLRGALTGDRAHDKGYITDLAWDLIHAGEVERGVALLREWSAALPTDPTFDLSLARRLVELERYEEAIEAADRALARGWGDNHLRAATAKAEALRGLGRIEESKAVAARELADQPAPTEAGVRANRYRAALQALAAGEAP